MGVVTNLKGTIVLVREGLVFGLRNLTLCSWVRLVQLGMLAENARRKSRSLHVHLKTISTF